MESRKEGKLGGLRGREIRRLNLPSDYGPSLRPLTVGPTPCGCILCRSRPEDPLRAQGPGALGPPGRSWGQGGLGPGGGKYYKTYIRGGAPPPHIRKLAKLIQHRRMKVWAHDCSKLIHRVSQYEYSRPSPVIEDGGIKPIFND